MQYETSKLDQVKYRIDQGNNKGKTEELCSCV